MTGHEALVKARELISEPKNWTQYALARPQPNGDVAYCASGALMRAAGSDEPCTRINDTAAWVDGLQALEGVISHRGGVVGFNNTGTHECVLAMFDAAIEATAPVPEQLPCGAEIPLA